GGEVNVTNDGATASLMVQDGLPQLVSRIGSGKWVRNQLPTEAGKIMVVGDYGLGAKAPYISDNDVKDVSKGSSFFSQGAGAGSNYFGGYGSGFSIKYDNSISFKLFIMGDGAVIAECLNAGDQRRNILWGTRNTTTDPQGFIKKASPIININPDGRFTTNDESEGATVTRVAQGEYLIEGVLGFNSDAGWGGI
ncbi:hypothetical protein HA378_25200, partial [Escherichia coli]|nr:hypothetical protein [Escherichia coli]